MTEFGGYRRSLAGDSRELLSSLKALQDSHSSYIPHLDNRDRALIESDLRTTQIVHDHRHIGLVADQHQDLVTLVALGKLEHIPGRGSG